MLIDVFNSLTTMGRKLMDMSFAFDDIAFDKGALLQYAACRRLWYERVDSLQDFVITIHSSHQMAT